MITIDGLVGPYAKPWNGYRAQKSKPDSSSAPATHEASLLDKLAKWATRSASLQPSTAGGRSRSHTSFPGRAGSSNVSPQATTTTRRAATRTRVFSADSRTGERKLPTRPTPTRSSHSLRAVPARGEGRAHRAHLGDTPHEKIIERARGGLGAVDLAERGDFAHMMDGVKAGPTIRISGRKDR